MIVAGEPYMSEAQHLEEIDESRGRKDGQLALVGHVHPCWRRWWHGCDRFHIARARKRWRLRFRSLSRQCAGPLFVRRARRVSQVFWFGHRAILCRCQRPVVLFSHSSCGGVVVCVVVGDVGAICTRGSAVSNTSPAWLIIVGTKGVRTMTLRKWPEALRW